MASGAATFPKIEGHTYALKQAINGVTLDVSDANTGRVTSTEAASGVIIVATKGSDTIESEHIEFFLFYVANKAALQAEIAKAITEYGNEVNLNYIDTSDVMDMSELFKDKHTFNGDISKWDTSSVKNMRAMFQNVHRFNKPLNNWSVSSVEDMTGMFGYATRFNQDISGWTEKSGRKIAGMFHEASA